MSALKSGPQSALPLQGKVVLVTGANSGLGKQAALELARLGADTVWLAARDIQKAETAADDIRAEVPNACLRMLEMDLAPFQSISSAADKFRRSADRLDVLLLNAGIMGNAPGLTADAYELHFGTNYLGHALFTKLVMPVLSKTASSTGGDNRPADSRVICLGSNLCNQAPGQSIDFDGLKTTSEAIGMMGRYGQSKLACVLFARALALHYPQITVAAVHPGVVGSNLGRDLIERYPFLRPLQLLMWLFSGDVETGARNSVWAATSPHVESGQYYYPVGRPSPSDAFLRDDELAEKLLNWTENELNLVD